MHGKRARMDGIPGSPPDLRALPQGCAFNPRCAWAMEQCRHDTPKLAPLNGSAREVACWLHRGDAKVPEELARPDQLPIVVEPVSVPQPGPSPRPPHEVGR
jgi:peptide/nickel transport system ATP-binding protein